MEEDPERRRIAELARRVREGLADDAEREELAMYAEREPEVVALVQRSEQEAELGGAWLARSTADDRLAALERTRLTRAERGAGVALVVGGVIGGLIFPPAAFAILPGAALLLFSVLRVKAQSVGKDPYDQIER